MGISWVGLAEKRYQAAKKVTYAELRAGMRIVVEVGGVRQAATVVANEMPEMRIRTDDGLEHVIGWYNFVGIRSKASA